MYFVNISNIPHAFFSSFWHYTWQENYINYRPSSAGKDDDGVKRMNLIARAAESIANGDIVNVQIRRYRQWQLSQTSSVASCILPYVALSLLCKITEFPYWIFLHPVHLFSLSLFQFFIVTRAKGSIWKGK